MLSINLPNMVSIAKINKHLGAFYSINSFNTTIDYWKTHQNSGVLKWKKCSSFNKDQIMTKKDNIFTTLFESNHMKLALFEI